MEPQLHSFLTFALDGVAKLTARPFNPGKERRRLLNRRLGGP